MLYMYTIKEMHAFKAVCSLMFVEQSYKYTYFYIRTGQRNRIHSRYMLIRCQLDLIWQMIAPCLSLYDT